MTGQQRIVALLVLVIAIVVVLGARHKRLNVDDVDVPIANLTLPRLVDLGSTTCTQCKKMFPVLDELKVAYADKLQVEFIDVKVDREASKAYNIRVIPTQIFFAADGRELYRHEGFISRTDILAKWSELGLELPAPTDGDGR
ncbi:MAG: thioredoxin family protein [bacterium]|nr:thioredoxin family protein [bacterium]